jgi:hypothetical protein
MPGGLRSEHQLFIVVFTGGTILAWDLNALNRKS